DRYPHELSGGQQQRVMIAMALASDPELLILDEPTTGLDATVEAEVLDLIEQLRVELSTAVLFISHNLAIVARLCDRVGVLYAGRLVEEGQARQVFDDPRHPYTAALLRCVPRRGMRKDVLRLDPIPGFLPQLGEAPPGCPFAPRCPLAVPECDAAPPPLIPVTGSSSGGASGTESGGASGAGSGGPAAGAGADGPAGAAARVVHTSACIRIEDVPGMEPSPAAAPTRPTSAADSRADSPVDSRADSPADSVADAAGSQSVEAGRSVVTVEGMVKRFRSAGAEVTAVDGVSLELKAGEIFGLVGESGSGKTTLARCIAGLLTPTDGTLALAAPKGREAHARFMQMVFQNPDTALNPRHLIRRILTRAQKRQDERVPAPQRRRRLEELVSSVRLQDRYLDVRPSALSGGLKQRVAIARAFAGKPALVLCDEPVSALDVSVQAAILNLLVDLQASRGASYLFISHDLGVVQYLSDRIGVMYLGEIVEVGPAQAVFEAPHHPYTEALLSAVPSLDIDAPRERIRLSGPPASLANPPAGCRFHSRCPRFLGEVCETQAPPWQKGGGGNTYRCHIPPEELVVLQRERPSESAAAD
ncbi:MAG TPA: ABC transporter ATP-binding protein, partial [Acidimicrobiales bacterium]|nr:ABC transporter ATP-binding protein [Acidimicrobiales bacterium]